MKMKGSYFKNRNIRIDRNILSYIICVIIAAILWFLNALNKEYTSEISYPVRYTDFPKGKYPVSSLPSTITLEVKAKGFTLVGYRISTSFLPISLDINSYSNYMLEKDNILEYTLKLSTIKDKINNQLNSDIKLLNIKPEEIYFKFSPAVSKVIPVKPMVDYSLKKQYILKDKISAVPDSILVSGPASLMDTLSYIPTETWKAGEINKNLSRTIDLEFPPNFSADEKSVKVNIELERFTEAKRNIPISVWNLPDSLNIKLFPNTVEISYEIGLSRYDKATDQDFEFIVNYAETQNSSFLPVEVVKFPPYIKNLSYTPQNVEYILEKRNR